MFKLFLSFLLLGLPVIQGSQLIPWSASRKLTWSDFRGTPDPRSGNAALTSSSINFDFEYNNEGFHYAIKCQFNKDRSWVRIQNNEILAHEQGHFDIAEMYARHLNKVMKAYAFNAKTVNSDVNKLYESAMKQHRQIQSQYDQETDYSRNKPKQQAWLKQIADELKALDTFSGYPRAL